MRDEALAARVIVTKQRTTPPLRAPLCVAANLGVTPSRHFYPCASVFIRASLFSAVFLVRIIIV